jgi:hypothetical protein
MLEPAPAWGDLYVASKVCRLIDGIGGGIED